MMNLLTHNIPFKDPVSEGESYASASVGGARAIMK